MNTFKIESGMRLYTFTNEGIRVGDYVIQIVPVADHIITINFDSATIMRSNTNSHYLYGDCLKYYRIDKIEKDKACFATHVCDLENLYKIKDVAKFRLTMFTNNCYLDMYVGEEKLSQLQVGDIVKFFTPTMYKEEHEATIYEDDGDLCILKDQSWFHLTNNYKFFRNNQILI